MSFIRLYAMQAGELRGAAAIAAVAAMIAVLFAGSTIVTPLYVIYQQEWGFSRITLTLIYAAYAIGNLIALLVFGRMSDCIGRRRTALPAIVVGVVSALVFLFAAHVISLYVGRILSGLSIGVGAGTGTAWLAELVEENDRARSATIATSANFLGLAFGALTSGLLAQFAPWPLRLSFIIYLAALVAVTVLVWRVRETISEPDHKLADLSLRPRLAVPCDIRAQFVAPAVTGFGAMALVGFYAALVPSILAEHLHQTSHALAGGMFFELAFLVAASILVTQRLSSRTAMLTALVLMIPSVALLVAAQAMESMPTMIAATAVCAVATGLGYRGSLQVVNQIAPEDHRAEVISSYFVCGFSGNALPVIGIGIISSLASPIVASSAFAATIVAFAVVALFFGVRYMRN
jgi:MFS family permease